MTKNWFLFFLKFFCQSYFKHGDGAKFQNLALCIIINSHFMQNCGGSINVYSADRFIASNNTVRKNKVTGEGGAINMIEISINVTIYRCVIYQNTANTAGGGVSIINANNINLRYTRLISNKAWTGASGGPGGGMNIAIFSYITIAFSIFQENTGLTAGGALLIENPNIYHKSSVFFSITFFILERISHMTPILESSAI